MSFSFTNLGSDRRTGSTSPGDGWVYAGKTVKVGAPKNGWQTTDLWKKAPAPAAPANGGGDNGGAGGPAPRNTGTYEDITAAYNEEIAKANAAAETWRNQQAEQIQAAQAAQAQQLAAIQQAAKQREEVLRQMMIQQEQAAAQQQALMQQQIQSANAAYEEQARQTAALGQAYVPAPEDSAATATTGDRRDTSTSQTNKLSELAIVSGLGTNSNPLAGLQLA